MADPAETVVRKLMDAWSTCDGEVIGQFLSDDAVFHNGPRGLHVGKEEVTTTFTGNMSICTNFHVDLNAIVSNGRTVMVERTDKFEINGKPLGVECVGVFDVNDEGLITRWREYYDLRSFEELQLKPAGLLPAG